MHIKLLALLPLATSVLGLVPISGSQNDIARRATCKTFQLFKSPDKTSGGAPGFVGNTACCCVNKQCVLHDYTDDVGADCSSMNASLGCNWLVISGSSQGTGSLDHNGATYTVSGGGAC